MSRPLVLEEILREHRAQLIGALARWCGDVHLAEDALSDAVVKAMERWAADPPEDPVAWLATVARNRIRDIVGSAHSQRTRALEERDADRDEHLPVRSDDTLGLMLACAHPAIDRGMHAPLILHVAMGLPASDIATALAVPQATLAKRLSRAKQKIRDSHIPLEVPDHVSADRVDGVLDAVYGAYAIDWLRESEVVERVTDEAIHASQLLLAAAPTHREIRGLAALLLYLHSRKPARIRDGMLVPTHLQDASAWDAILISRAEALLRRGLTVASAAEAGKYELQAAIQSAHTARRTTNEIDWRAIRMLHTALVSQHPTKGAVTAHAVAVANDGDLDGGIALLTTAAIEAFQPYHAALGELLARRGETRAAVEQLRRAASLTTDAAARRYLERQIGVLEPSA